MFDVVFLEESLTVSEILLWFPGRSLKCITLPKDQILKFSMKDPVLKDFLYLKLRRSLNKLSPQILKDLMFMGIRWCRMKETDVKDIVNAVSFGKLKLISKRTNRGDHGEGTNPTRTKFM